MTMEQAVPKTKLETPESGPFKTAEERVIELEAVVSALANLAYQANRMSVRTGFSILLPWVNRDLKRQAAHMEAQVEAQAAANAAYRSRMETN